MADPYDQASDKTIEAARSLWGHAVTIDASPALTIKASRSQSASSDSMRAHPRPRELSREGDTTLGGAGIDFELGHLLGRGGMGMVYAARQASLDREIAVKMINTASANDPDSVRKFLAEALVTGHLDHPNIVPVYDVGGTPDGTVFYAMKEVAGTAWDKAIGTMSLKQNLRVLLSVCDAVAFAHDKGIVHRDLKPENVMLGEYGEILVMDWGLALRMAPNDAAPLNKDAGLAGTPAYMAPEMANCEVAHIGMASDVYLLGGILYELVTGQKPHAGPNVFATISAAMENRIQPTDRAGELLDIARKAMATKPSDRYGSVKAFQQAIRAYQEHAESLAISTACNERLTRLENTASASLYREANEIVAGFQQALQLWADNRAAAAGLCAVRKIYVRIALGRGDLALAGSQLSALEAECKTYDGGNDVAQSIVGLRTELKHAMARAAAHDRLIHVSTTVAVLGALAVIGVTGAAYVLTRRQRDAAVEARQAESLQRENAQRALTAAQEANYYNLIALADRDLAQAQPAAAETRLRAAPPGLRGWEWGALAYLCRRSLLTVRAELPPVCSAAFDASGDSIVAADLRNNVTILNGWTGKPVASVVSGVEGIFAVAFQPAGGNLLLVSHDGQIRVWDAVAARELSLTRLEGFKRDLIAVAIAPDAGHIAGLARDGRVSIWNASTGNAAPDAHLPGRVENVSCIAVSSDLAHLATGRDNGTIELYNVASGSVLRVLTPNTTCLPIVSIAFAPDGRHLAAGTSSRLVQVWDARTGDAVLTLGAHATAVTALAFSADGRRLVTAGSDRTISVWDARNDRTFLALTAHAKPVTAVAFSPDGRLAATGGDDATVRLWDARTWRVLHALRGHTGPITRIDFNRAGTRVLSAAQDGTARLWDVDSGALRHELGDHDGPVACAAFSPDGAKVLTTDSTSVKIWDAATGARIGTLRGAPGAFRVALFSPDGTAMLTAGNEIALWNASSGKKSYSVAAPGGTVQCAAFAPDGACFATGDQSAGRLWNTVDGTELLVLEGQTCSISCVAFTPDGGRILTGSLHGAVLWNTSNGRELLTLAEHKSWVTSAAFSPDGRCLLTGGNDATARVRAALDWNRDIDSLRDWKQALYRTWAGAQE